MILIIEVGSIPYLDLLFSHIIMANWCVVG